jgi:hypothetical protein
MSWNDPQAVTDQHALGPYVPDTHSSDVLPTQQVTLHQEVSDEQASLVRDALGGPRHQKEKK